MSLARENFLDVPSALRAAWYAPPGKWRVKPRCLKRAADHLGLTRPVEVRSMTQFGIGYYLIQESMDAGHHVLAIGDNLHPVIASTTIWHELTHAVQAERSGRSPMDWWLSVHDRWKPLFDARLEPNVIAAVLAIPEEVEAVQNEVNHWDVCSLARHV